MDKKVYLEPAMDIYDLDEKLPILAASVDIDDETGEAPTSFEEI